MASFRLTVPIPTPATATTTTTLFIESTPTTFDVITAYTDAIVVLSDGSFVLCSSDRTAKRWLISTTTTSTTNDNNTMTLELVGTFAGHTADVATAVEKRDNNTLITSAFDSTLKEWDIRTCECLRTINIDGGSVRNMAITKDESKVLCGVSNGLIELRTASDLGHICTIDIHDRHSINWCCELEDGSFVSCAYTTMKRWKEDGKVIQTFAGGAYITRVIELDNDTLVTTSGGKEVTIWKASTGECLRTLEQHHIGRTRLVKLSRNKFVTRGNDLLRVWNDEGCCIETISLESICAMARVGNHFVTVRYPTEGFSVRRLR